MKRLSGSDRRALGWGVAGATGLAIVGSFWALPHIEDELDESSLEADELVEVKGATVEWNGRDGYLTLPEGMSELEGELLAAEVADLGGPRDVEIVGYDGPALAAKAVPADFSVVWNAQGRTASGVVPNGSANAYNGLFGVNDLAPEVGRTLTPEVEERLRTSVAPLIGTDLLAGSLVVVDNTITVRGEASDDEARARVSQALLDAGVDTIDISVAAAPELDSANFELAWDGDGASQQGSAPADLDLGGFGIKSPDSSDSLFVTPQVSVGLDVLADSIGSDLVSGRAVVENGSVLTVTGVAADDAALGRVEAALSASGASTDLRVSQEAEAQVALDSVLQLERVEFLSGTAIPTAATEAIIDEVAEVLNQYETINVSIVGHTDSQGEDAANQALSEQRAEAIAVALESRGIDRSRMTTEGLGESDPIDTNDTPEGRQNNRRVAITAKESN